ncbi:MAG: hypothetical protein P8Y36_04530, partial [Alphaproteobacteria bacterium]
RNAEQRMMLSRSRLKIERKEQGASGWNRPRLFSGALAYGAMPRKTGGVCDWNVISQPTFYNCATQNFAYGA